MKLTEHLSSMQGVKSDDSIWKGATAYERVNVLLHSWLAFAIEFVPSHQLDRCCEDCSWYIYGYLIAPHHLMHVQ